MNKSVLTNIISFIFVAISFFITDTTIKQIFLYAGLFALSGAVTNQLAIYMLFEKVPFLYGSGVIEANFESFKNSIKNLIMTQFFTKEQLDNFFQNEEKKLNLVPIIEQTDFTPAYEALSKSVMESNFGGMLAMFGGESALEGLKEPFVNKLKSSIISIVSSKAFDDTLQNYLKSSTLSDDLILKIDTLVQNRLNELTPKMVKEIIQNLIKEHLGWLVVWGGVFGGLIGVISSFLLN
jgi:uncharacterized membrane protein YheB (UPF0754 family)